MNGGLLGLGDLGDDALTTKKGNVGEGMDLAGRINPDMH